MEGPGKMIRRATCNRRQACFSAAQHKPAMESDGAGRPASARYPTGHANYTALMRSHDRVHTRHLKGQS